MAEVIEMIQLSPTMEEGKLVKWMKSEGDTIDAGDVIAEVETDKANMDMESFYDGTILKILVAEGASLAVGVAMAVVGEPDEDITELLATLSSKSGGDAPSGHTGAGPSESLEAPAAENPAVETDEPAVGESAAAAPPPESEEANAGRLRSSPLARKLAEHAGIQLRDVKGSGPAGRIIKRDVEAYVEAGATSSSPSTQAPARSSASPPAAAGAQEGRLVALSPMRKSIAKNLSVAWQAPAFMLTREIAMDRAVALRAELNEGLVANGRGKVSLNDFVIKAAGRALVDCPEMNVAFQQDGLVMYDRADVGVAVAVDGGLITPIIRGAESASLSDIATQMRSLAERARAKKLAPEEYTGSTFSVSNLGMFGIDHFTAVLNPPAAGILAVGAVAQKPIVRDDGTIGVGARMNVTLTCDHRAVDGAIGATFLQHLVRYLEQPLMMLA